MATTVERKEYPISMRRPDADVLMENRLIRMAPEGFAEFMEVLSAPTAPVPELVELVKRPAPWEAGYVAKR
ncbi:MAG: type II toxin-antitoxin system TacA family antitoxin [Allorhizobium sp.]